jgi:hypothetical protein
MPEEDPSNENGWGEVDGRFSRSNVVNIRSRLDRIARAQDVANGGLGKLQDTVGKALEVAAERGYSIRRIEDRLADLQARFGVVEANYVKAADHEKELAPFRKWGSWIGMLVIGGVVTALMALLFGKGN